MEIQRILKVIVLISAASSAWAASPCEGVDRSLTKERSAALAPVVAKHLGVKRVDVLQSFRTDEWSIIYVETYRSDETFVFYAHDPLTSHYITLWSGAARADEEQGIRKWAFKNAPGIPRQLATCFAWHVTKDRDK